MNFEKVEVYGFKSFADKAEIKFGNGITGIVGPNGCGKSNVADAIRWVLGEQSAKTLRGSSMQDVIFAGTQNRKSLSYCEVSLYFDNTNRMFDLDYNEVIITRKLFRSGESEYYINKQVARLKDIVALLHQCGIGKEGYTIIGQGKVEEIMSAKPEDRRMIFEEATGIAKFKASKNESENKLKRTHENLVRYTDILSEIENQLAPLEKQAGKAKEYNEISEELKHHELNTYIAKVDGVEDSKNKIYIKIKGIDEATALREKELKEAQAEYDQIFSDIDKADAKLHNLNDELLEKRVEMEKNSGTKQLYQEKTAFLLGQIERADNEIQENYNIIDSAKASIEKNGGEINNAQNELNEVSKKFDDASRKLLLLNEKIALGEELQTANTKKVIESIESLTDLKVNKGTMSIERLNLNDKKAELVAKLDDLSVKRDKLFNDKEKCDSNINDLDRSISELKSNILDQENLVRSLNEEVAKVDNKIYSLNSTITSLVTKENFYRGLKENYEGYMPSVKLLLNNAKSNPQIKNKILGVVAEIIKSDKIYDIALETALGNAAQNVVTATVDDGSCLIKYLKEKQLGRATFLPLTSVRPRPVNPTVLLALKEKGALGVANELVSYDKKFENIISNLLGNTLIVDTLDNATVIANKYPSAFKMVTLDGDVFSNQGAMTGGSRRQDMAGILSSDRKIEEMSEQIKIKREEMDKLKAEKSENEKKRDKALDDLSMMNEMYNGKRQQVLLEREKQTVAETALIEIGRDIENATDLIEDVDNRIAKLDEAYQSVDTGSKELEDKRKTATSNADKHQAEFDALKKERDEYANKSTELQVRSTELKALLSSLKEDNSRLENAISEAESSIERLKKSNDGARGIIENIKRDQEKIALTKEEQDYINGIRAEIDGIENHKIGLKEKLSLNDEKKQRATMEKDELLERKHAQEIALAKIDSDLEYLQQSIWEDYQETYETAVKQREENYDANFGEQEIARLRKRRSSLGTINGSAIEDFKIMKERYDEMTAQKEDLEKAENNLKEAIDKIKGEMLTQFDEGFAKINENFQRIFKELFGGGRAMLELDYSEVEDRLEAGVEIIAEPPGKKLQKLSLLSGGEKALTAIAILFSILKLRPMPFCVLDEIEAALDEANVDRFARYLKKFSEDTQFIVITHRKPTMELADALFGVTMQEKGVSKMVSVKLSDVATLDDQLA